MTQPSIAHGGFTIERQYDAPPVRVFAAWSNIETKAQWFIGPAGWTQVRREQSFKTGGTEILQGRFANGMETRYDARFYEIIENERIVYVYDMHIRARHHSVSLATVEIASAAGGTRLIYTEHTAWLDGTDATEGAASREHGVSWHLNNLADVLRGAA
jgi:uncharacterized protein YndB with AHSA1/START domain